MTDQLRFEGDTRRAALHLIHGTSLADSMGEAPRWPLMLEDYNPVLVVTVGEGWRWSSGETVLLNLLRWFAEIDLTRLDVGTQRVAFRALVLSTGRSVDELAVGS